MGFHGTHCPQEERGQGKARRKNSSSSFQRGHYASPAAKIKPTYLGIFKINLYFNVSLCGDPKKQVYESLLRYIELVFSFVLVNTVGTSWDVPPWHRKAEEEQGLKPDEAISKMKRVKPCIRSVNQAQPIKQIHSKEGLRSQPQGQSRAATCSLCEKCFF